MSSISRACARASAHLVSSSTDVPQLPQGLARLERGQGRQHDPARHQGHERAPQGRREHAGLAREVCPSPWSAERADPASSTSAPAPAPFAATSSSRVRSSRTSSRSVLGFAAHSLTPRRPFVVRRRSRPARIRRPNRRTSPSLRSRASLANRARRRRRTRTRRPTSSGTRTRRRPSSSLDLSARAAPSPRRRRPSCSPRTTSPRLLRRPSKFALRRRRRLRPSARR